MLEYAQRLKNLTDGLPDLEQPVSDPILPLALLRGMASILKMKTPLPSFIEAQSVLALEESELQVSTLAATFIVPRGAFVTPCPIALMLASFAATSVLSVPFSISSLGS
jgi:hypothetical protein